MSIDKPPLATYRIQFTPDFGFSKARPLVPYLSRLGITHIYSSPLLRPRPGSAHAYDVADPTTLNPDLGDETQFRELVGELRAHGMGIILDIVPNHMAASTENPFWQHVLTYGLSSPYARWFDIDWRTPDKEVWGRVILPVLGEALNRVIGSDQISIVWERARFRIKYFDHLFPLDPATVPPILEFGEKDLEERLRSDHPALPELRAVLTQLDALPSRSTRVRRKIALNHDEVEAQLATLARIIEDSPPIHGWATQTAAAFAGGEAGRKRLRSLLNQQSYRLTYWRKAARNLNYRRFFDINDLVAIRQEDPEVFNETHVLIKRWLDEGAIDGVRVDHVDGLRDPLGYLRRLNDVVTAAQQDHRPRHIFVEKILGPEEELRTSWPVSGTSGYDFLNQVEALFIDPDGMRTIEQSYRRLTRSKQDFREIANWGKQRVLENELSPFVGQLAATLHRLAGQDPATAQISVEHLEEAVTELVVCLPVYRTYVDDRPPWLSDEDRELMEHSLNCVRERRRVSDAAVDFLESVLLLKGQAELSEHQQRERLNFIQRLQQLSGPAAAKGIEDTALYIYVPLASLNEVGGEPDIVLDEAVDRLHDANERRMANRPFDMLAATTHDTKRNADVRARLDVLSEIPKVWFDHVNRWRTWNAPHRGRAKGKPAPDAGSEYLFYQSLVGIWPVAGSELPSPDKIAELRERLEQYMLKATRETKVRTSWVNQNQEFEDALNAFIRGVLNPDDAASQFLTDMNEFVRRITRPGFWNSISRVLLQYTTPGTPDLYQGDELWNFALVDPDNRRPVDYEARSTVVDDIAAAYDGPEDAFRGYLPGLVESPEDGRIKCHVIRTALHARRHNPDLFTANRYERLEANGNRARHAFAFARSTEAAAMVVIAPRLIATLLDDPNRAPIGDVWDDTSIPLPERLHGLEWRCALTARTIEPTSALRLGDLLEEFPAALLIARRPA